MRLAIFLSLWTISSAFTVTPIREASTSTSLYAVTTPPDVWDNMWQDNRSKSKEPVADRVVSKIDRMMMEDVVLDNDYGLTIAMALVAPFVAGMGWFASDGHDLSLLGILGCGFHLLMAAFIGVQTSRVRCVFEEDVFELYNLQKGKKLVSKPGNFETGTRNRWDYDSIVNYNFFPSETFPLLCYFKETATDQAQWDKSIAKLDTYGKGQPHFFPGIFNVKQFKEQMRLRGVKRKNGNTRRR